MAKSYFRMINPLGNGDSEWNNPGTTLPYTTLKRYKRREEKTDTVKVNRLLPFKTIYYRTQKLSNITFCRIVRFLDHRNDRRSRQMFRFK